MIIYKTYDDENEKIFDVIFEINCHNRFQIHIQNIIYNTKSYIYVYDHIEINSTDINLLYIYESANDYKISVLVNFNFDEISNDAIKFIFEAANLKGRCEQADQKFNYIDFNISYQK